MLFSTDSRLFGVLFTGVMIFASFLPGDCLTFAEAIHDRFSFPCSSSTREEEELGLPETWFPPFAGLLELCPERSIIGSEGNSLLLEAHLGREG
jgi:hypothetical protein